VTLITAATVARKCKLRGTLTTVTQSATVDEMNRPLDVETSAVVKFWWHPEQGSEITAGRIIATGRQVAYFPACYTVTDTSKLTYAGLPWQVDGTPETWIHPMSGEVVGTVARMVRTA
jgi:hypothetical protein